ncbi:reverse transcriptase domain-containing protein [Rufibacter ruber]|uniref:reverse transcriptase domain-containing protein n=1 Tax=Rufibacter ruber TaxID=1783499 RepID=UPI000834D07F|nr:reverse transcriptase domain-containing protein [Rufibacter ruber]
MLTPSSPTSLETDWQRSRLYPHFDSEYTSYWAKAEIRRQVENVDWVAKRQFLPLIKREVVTWKRKKAPVGHASGKKRILKRKKRSICFASHTDAHIYSFYAYKLKEPYEKVLEKEDIQECVIAYRPVKKGFCNIHYARDVFSFIKQKQHCVALLFDVEKFFDTLNHEKLKSTWGQVQNFPSSDYTLGPDVFNIYKSLTKFSYIPEGQLKKNFKSFYSQPFTERSGKQICSAEDLRALRKKRCLSRNNKEYGIPQGSSLSAVLANIYMLPFDIAMKDFCNDKEILYRRYSDDILVVCDPEQVSTVEEKVNELIAERNLKINPDKTERLSFNPNPNNLSELDCTNLATGVKSKVQYLGFTFDGTKVNIRRNSIGRYTTKLNKAAFAIAKGCKKKNDPPLKGYIRRRLFEGYTLKRREKTNFLTYANRAEKIMSEVGFDVSKISTFKNKHLASVDKVVNKAFLKFNRNLNIKKKP